MKRRPSAANPRAIKSRNLSAEQQKKAKIDRTHQMRKTVVSKWPDLDGEANCNRSERFGVEEGAALKTFPKDSYCECSLSLSLSYLTPFSDRATCDHGSPSKTARSAIAGIAACFEAL